MVSGCGHGDDGGAAVRPESCDTGHRISPSPLPPARCQRRHQSAVPARSSSTLASPLFSRSKGDLGQILPPMQITKAGVGERKIKSGGAREWRGREGGRENSIIFQNLTGGGENVQHTFAEALIYTQIPADVSTRPALVSRACGP